MVAGYGRPVYKAIDFTTDTLFTLGLSLWLVIVLLAVFCPLKGVGVRSRIKSVVISAAAFIFCFIVRCLILGASACQVEPFAVCHYCDPPLRVIALSAILIIGFGYLLGDDEDETDMGRSSQKVLVAMLIVALDVLVGCNGNLSNNTITVNVGGGGGDVLPYLAILVMVAWSARQNFKGREKAETTGGRPRKGRRPAFTQKAVAVLCGKDVNTVARWESGAIRPPLDYTAELRMKGGVGFFDWVREYNAHNGVADIFIQIRKGNVAYTEGLTEREKGLVEEYIQALRQG